MLERWHRLPSVAQYLLPRLLALAISWFLATIAIFILLFVVTDPLGHVATFPEQNRVAIRHQLGLDRSNYQLYREWLADMARGDLGTSNYFRSSVGKSLKRRAEPTIELLALGLLLGCCGGLALQPLRRGRWPRTVADVLESATGALPVFIAGPLVLEALLSHFGYSPPVGHVAHLYRHPWENLKRFGLPLAFVALPVASYIGFRARSPATGSRSVGPDQYVMARSIAPAFSIAASTVVVTEFIFHIPGIGLYLLTVAFNSEVFAMRSPLVIVAFVALAIWLLPPRASKPASPPVPWESHLIRDLRRDPLSMVALALIVIWIVAGLIGPLVSPYDPQSFVAGRPNESPSFSHLFGTDSIGRDQFSRALSGVNTSLRLAAVVFFVGFVPGVPFAFFAARVQWLRWLVVELGRAWHALPWLLVLFAVTFPYGYGLIPLGTVLSIGAFLSAATLASGFGAARGQSIRELWQVAGVKIMAAGISVITFAILAEATMGFIGFTVAKASLGREFADMRNYYPFPVARASLVGGTLCLSLFAFNLMRTRVLTLASTAPPPDEENVTALRR